MCFTCSATYPASIGITLNARRLIHRKNAGRYLRRRTEYIYIYISTRIYIYINIYILICMYIYLCIFLYTHIHMHIHIHNIRLYTYICIQCVYIYAHIYICSKNDLWYTTQLRLLIWRLECCTWHSSGKLVSWAGDLHRQLVPGELPGMPRISLETLLVYRGLPGPDSYM